MKAENFVRDSGENEPWDDLSDPNFAENLSNKEAFEHFKMFPPRYLNAMDELLLCLPEIAAAEAARATDPLKKEGWKNLENEFYWWFPNSSDFDLATSSKFFQIRPGWFLAHERAKIQWESIRNYFDSEAGQKQLTKILKDEHKFTNQEENFDFIAQHPSRWIDLAHQSRKIDFFDEDGRIDGITIALGRCSLVGLAKGIVEPLRDGYYQVKVTGGAIALVDVFGFEGPFQPLGLWSCLLKRFMAYVPLEPNAVFNFYFTLFQNRHSHGRDFYVIIPPQHIDGFKEFDYVVKP